MNDDLYVDIHKEMERTSDSFSAVIVRRLNKLIELESKMTRAELVKENKS